MAAFDDAALTKVLGLLDVLGAAADEVSGWEAHIEQIGEALAEMEETGSQPARCESCSGRWSGGSPQLARRWG
ncbi:hypothetical protein KGQ20_07300 [Catenulispora sp. NF23]|uniref:hypothetical protein n=1 Tax=Catenulispora pinistramenti TaxID=2705254 RepID=UPI001BA837D3|nr:hypothetical protein [Catenulispora pinistramenti]MBS2532575.1 hypothetical protein [Catenulispora pinistramenti]